MAKAYHIDVRKQTVKPVTVNGIADMHRLIGGYLEIAHIWKNGDTLYVDEEGLNKEPEYFFWLLPERADQPLCSNGLLVGAEKEFADGSYTILDPKGTLEQLKAKVSFGFLKRK